jgi:hypothetical protein
MPPMVNRRAAALFDEFTISITAGDDFVSRINLHSLELLRADVMRLLDNCDLPKYKIFASALSTYLFSSDKKKNKRLINRTRGGTAVQGELAETEEQEILRISKEVLSVPKQLRQGNQAHFIHTIKGTYPPMFLPGRILYLEKIRNPKHEIYESKTKKKEFEPIGEMLKRKLKRGQTSIAKFIEAAKEKFIFVNHEPLDYKYAYIPRWADKEEFQEIAVSRSMIRDHTIIFGIFKEWEAFEAGTPLKSYS